MGVERAKRPTERTASMMIPGTVPAPEENPLVPLSRASRSFVSQQLPEAAPEPDLVSSARRIRRRQCHVARV